MEGSSALAVPGTFRNELDRLFDDFFGGSWLEGWDRPRGLFAPMDIVEDQEAYLVKMDLPGLNQKDVQISMEGSRLTIRGERKEELKDKQAYRVERHYGEFLRAVDLPDSVDPNQVSATFKDGVLSVRLAKKPEAKPKTIQIKAD